MKKLLTKSLLIVACLLGGGINSWATPTLVFSEDFSGTTYDVSWGGTKDGGISPAANNGILTVANGSSSGDRSAYVNFGNNAVEGCAHLKFDMGMTKSNWSGKNNTFYLFSTNTTARYPSTDNSVMIVNQDFNGYITINGEALNTSTAYNSTVLTYDVYLNTTTENVRVVVSNGNTVIKSFNYSSTATGIGAMHLTFNKNYGAFVIDNIYLYSITAPNFTLAENAKTVTIGGSESVTVTDITGNISVSSNNTATATASFENGLITINGVATGVTTITVTGENDGLIQEKTIDVTVGEVAKTTVTVNYVCGSEAIADPLILTDVAVGSILTSNEVVYDAIIYGSNCRYTNPQLSQSLPYTVVENGIINITYTKQNAVSSITVKYIFNNEEVASEAGVVPSLYVDDTYSVPFRMYIAKEGKLYKTTANSSDPYYGESTVLTENTIVEKSVTEVNINGGTIVLFEDLDAGTGDNAGIRASYCSSYGNMSYTSPNDLEAGIYTLIFRGMSRNRGSSVKVGEKTILYASDFGNTNNWADKELTNVVIPEAGKLTFVKGGSNTIDYYDIIIAIKTGDLPTTVATTIGANGYTTFASPYCLNLANLPEGLEAYTATLTGNTLSFVKCTQAVPAGTGLLLAGTGGETYNIPVAESGTAISDNALTGVTKVTNLKSDESTNYIFAMKKAKSADDPLTFAPLTSDAAGVNFPIGKAYISVPASVFNSGSARALTVSFGDEATGIQELKNSRIEGLKTYFDLQGRRVALPTKGLYIKDGRKVVIK